jgi:hypothetical protein
LINSNGTMVAHVCHIAAAMPGGPRFDKDMTDKQRHSASNLILLCGTCHKLVDEEPERFKVKLLRKWKKDRESRFEAIGDTLRQRYHQQITDEAISTGITTPKSLKSFSRFLKKRHNFPLEVQADLLKGVEKYVHKLRNLTKDDRELVAAIVNRALSLPRRNVPWDTRISIHPHDLRTLLIDERRLSDNRIRELCETLDRHGLGGLDIDEKPEVYIRSPDDDLRWVDIADFADKNDLDLRVFIVNLQFGLLD